MKTVLLLICISTVLCVKSYAQPTVAQVASNRIIQKHHLPAQIQKIGEIDSVRLSVLWSYFTESFTFETTESNLTVEDLLNLQQFDITAFEQLRSPDEQIQFIYRNTIQITLKTTGELTTLLAGYQLNDLLTKLPARPFPAWTSESFTDEAFNAYKLLVWDWAKDYESEYLTLTSDPTIRHIHFSEISNMPHEKQEQLLSGNYIIVD